MSRFYKSRQLDVRAFTLLELLVVISIAAMLYVLAAGSIGSLSRSNNLNLAAQQLVDQIRRAKQEASALGVPVEIRLFHLPDFGSLQGSPRFWRAYQLYVGDQPLDRVIHFPSRVIVSTSTTASPLARAIGDSDPVTLPGSGSNAFVYRAIRIRPDGRVTIPNPISPLPDDEWFLSIHHENQPAEESGLPANFATIQINPRNANAQVLRPR